MAQRGGSVIAQIRYGREVNSPLIAEGEAQVLGALEQIEAIRYAHYLAAGGLAVVSNQAVVPVTVSSGQATYPKDTEQRLTKLFPRLVYRDVARIAAELGNMLAANTVLLGAMSKGVDLAVEAWHEAIRSCLPPKHHELNLKAFDAGRGLA